MVSTLLDETPKPLIMILDYSSKGGGGLTYRQLHLQVRRSLDLPAGASLRMVPHQALAPIHYQLLSNLGIDRTTKRSHFGSSLLLADSFVKRYSNSWFCTNS